MPWHVHGCVGYTNLPCVACRLGPLYRSLGAAAAAAEASDATVRSAAAFVMQQLGLAANGSSSGGGGSSDLDWIRLRDVLSAMKGSEKPDPPGLTSALWDAIRDQASHMQALLNNFKRHPFSVQV